VTRASILIPSHDKPTTLPLTVDSALRQTVDDLEVIVIGDGVTDEVRATVEQLTRADGRVRFLDLPKGPHHGERYRHDAILESRSDAIFYLCDDDLLLPDHVADLLALLEDHNFVQAFNGRCLPNGDVGFFPADLSNPHTISLMLAEHLRYNAVSVTGTAHSRAFYEVVDDRWDTTPGGQWPDHHQWRKFFRHPEFRGATSHRMTALQFPTSEDGRDSWTDAEREAELKKWHAIVTAPDGQAQLDALVHRSALRTLGLWRDDQVQAHAVLALLREQLAALQVQYDIIGAARERELDELRAARRALHGAQRRLARKNVRLARLRRTNQPPR
jgi:hypothetical protein